ncbi:HPr family phosphocarrier protein [Bacteroides thetaiotaomicron]|nr:HPr family phosphocarrier protein [Bacteroides thetaiotaomicron]
MYAKEFTIQNRTGLHARPASDFVALAATFKSKIELSRAGEADRYNGKSIIMLLTLGLMQGERATLSAEGEDEREAVDALAELVANMQD